MRVSQTSLTHEQAMAIEAGYPVTVKNWAGGGNLRIKSLKNINRHAYDAHLAELEINGQTVRINVADLTQALRYV